MLTIRPGQIQTLGKTTETEYLKSATAYFEYYDPVTAASAGPGQLQTAAREGLASARRHGLSSGPGLQLYLELMITLGSGFDSDPQFHWLSPYLEPESGMGVIERVRLIHFHAAAYLERAYGPSGEFAKEALGRALDVLSGLHTQERVVDEEPFDLLSRLHPEKADFLDLSVAADLQAAARETATGAGLLMPPASTLLLLLLFFFGRHVASDPLHSWVSDVLTWSGDSEARFQQLVRSARSRVETDLRYLEEKVS